MKSFNLKKKAKEDFIIHDKMVEENRGDMNLSPPDVNTEVNLKTNTDISDRGREDNTLLYEGQMDNARINKKYQSITEGELNKEEKLFNDKRLDIWDTNINNVNNIVSQAFDQEKLEAFKEAEGQDQRDTSFWDKYVGVQLDGEKTTIVNNVQKSQLQNVPERFKGLEKTQPISGELSKNDNMLKKDNNIYDMVTASLKKADSDLFHIYASSFRKNKKLNNSDIKNIKNINNYKLKILAQLDQQQANNSLSTAINQVGYPPRPRMSDNPELKTEIDNYGNVIVYENGKPIDKFNNIEEARANYPGEVN